MPSIPTWLGRPRSGPAVMTSFGTINGWMYDMNNGMDAIYQVVSMFFLDPRTPIIK